MSAQSAVCECKQLRTLILRPLKYDEKIDLDVNLLQRVVASLPQLRVALIYKAC